MFVILEILPICALINVIRTPKEAFAAVGRNRTRWIVVLIVAGIYLSGGPFALYWFFRVAKQIREGPNENELSQRLQS